MQPLTSLGQQWIRVMLEAFQGAPGSSRVGHVQQLVDHLAPRQPLRRWQFGPGTMLFGLEQAVQLQVGLLLPVQLQQLLEQCLLLFLAKESISQAQIERISGVDRCAGQPQEQAELAGQAGQKPAGPTSG